MKQRVALARALAQDADVLLMDEPFALARRDHARPACTRSSTACGPRRALTILFVTHNAREAVRLGDRVLVFTSRPGRVATRSRSTCRDRAASTRPSWPCHRRPHHRAPEAGDAAAWRLRLSREQPRSHQQVVEVPERQRRRRAAVVLAVAEARRARAVPAASGRWSCGRAGGRTTSCRGPVPVFQRLGQDLGQRRFLLGVGVTLRRALVGYAIAVVIGSALGLLVARVPIVRKAVGHAILGLQSMPSIAWFPLAILLFQLDRGRDPLRRHPRRRACGGERAAQRRRPRAAAAGAGRPRDGRARPAACTAT